MDIDSLPAEPSSLKPPGPGTPLPRTPEEIVSRMRDHGDIFGFAAEALLDCVSSPHADVVLKPEYHGKHVATVTTLEHASACARDYCRFAWGKARGQRGISASRSVTKLAAWMWLIGRDDLVAFAEDDGNYAQYGVPILKKISEEMGWGIPNDPDLAAMAEGRMPAEDDDG